MICFKQRQEFLDFSNEILDFDLELSDVKMISELNEQGELQAVATFSNCSKFNMEISIASKNWSASRAFIRECAHYAFITCGVLRLTIFVAENNVKSLEFSERLGFKREFENFLKSWFGDINGVQLVMMKEDCLWLNT